MTGPEVADLVIRGALVIAILWGVARVAEQGHRTDQAMRDLDDAIERYKQDDE